MSKNMGFADRVVRFLVAAVIALLYLDGRIHGVGALVLGAVAALMLATALVGWCPAYVPFGFSTVAAHKGPRL